MNEVTRIDGDVEAPARFTIDEFMRLLDTGVFEGSRVELVEGEIVRMSPALSPHKLIQRDIFRQLDQIIGEQAEWAAFFELSVRFGKRTLRDIDAAIVRPFGTEIDFADPANILLAVEVSASTLGYDLGNKLRDYASAGIPHYWVVNVPKQRVHVMTNPLDGDYTERYLVAFGQPLAVPGTDRTITIT